MKAYRKKLTVIWFVGSGLTFALLVFQALIGKYHGFAQEVFGWFMPTVMPTLLMIVGVWVIEVTNKAAPLSRPDIFLFKFAKWLSIAYLVFVALVILMQPLSSMSALEMMNTSHLFLGPFQGLVAAIIGAFFVKG